MRDVVKLERVRQSPVAIKRVQNFHTRARFPPLALVLILPRSDYAGLAGEYEQKSEGEYAVPHP